MRDVPGLNPANDVTPHVLENLGALGVDYLIPIGGDDSDAIMGTKKVVDVDLFYNTERLRPSYKTFLSKPLFIMTSQA